MARLWDKGRARLENANHRLFIIYWLHLWLTLMGRNRIYHKEFPSSFPVTTLGVADGVSPTVTLGDVAMSVVGCCTDAVD